MPAPTVSALLAHRELGLRLLTPATDLPDGALDAEVSWVHSTDLADPTPFVIPGQVLLTTGTQFGATDRGSSADRGLSPYRGLSADRGLSLSKPDPSNGFRQAQPAVERQAQPAVERQAQPAAARHPQPAAARHPQPAVERPTADDDSDYDGYVARLARAGIAGLGFGTDVVRETPDGLAAACLQRGIPLFEVPYRTPFIAVARYAADLVAEQAYARNTWALSALRAVSLAALRSDGLAATLAELARQLGRWVVLVDAGGAIERVFPAGALPASARADVEAEATRMLKAGRRAASTLVEADAVVSLQTIGASDRLLGVIAHGGPDDVDQAVQQVVTSVVALAGLALDQGRALTSARATMRAVLVRALDDVRTLAGEYGGLDDQSGLSSADVKALDKARSHVEAAGRRAVAAEEASAAPQSAPTAAHAVAPAVGDADARAQASALLAPLIARDRDGVLAASVLVWLEHNGVYDAAARALGVHRHTLTARIRTAERALGNDFASFARRAEVWSALRTLGVTTS